MLAVFLTTLIICPTSFAETLKVDPSKEVTGLTWLQMSAGERMDYLMTSMFILTGHGVKFGKSPNDYYDAVNERLRFNPDLYSANVTNILASIVYEQEPGSREALDQIKKKPEIQKIEMP